MLGPILETLLCLVQSQRHFFSCYVRSVSGDFVMLGPISEALFFACYVRPDSGDFVMLGPIMEKIVILGRF